MSATEPGLGDRLASAVEDGAQRSSNAVEANPRASAGLVALLAVVSLLFLRQAVLTDEAFGFVWRSAIGALVGAIALAGVTPVVRGFIEADEPDPATADARRRTWRNRAWAMEVGGFVVTAVASLAFSSPFSVVEQGDIGLYD